MKNNYEERAQKFIQKVFPFIEEDMFNPYFVEDMIDNFNEHYHRKVKVSYGDARIALITSDYVVKFDYNNEAIEEIGGCKQELEFYSHAVEDGFDYLFAKTSRYNYAGYSFYIMPKINHIGEHHYHANYFMTEEEVTWCNEHNLTDLHSHNYGFRKGKVCIIDYAYIKHEYDLNEEEY